MSDLYLCACVRVYVFGAYMALLSEYMALLSTGDLYFCVCVCIFVCI